MRKRTVLIVDDNMVNRQILSHMLAAEYDVLEATDGVEALERLRADADAFSAVLLDLIMPRMDGYEVLRQMNADRQLSRLPVIVTSGSTESEAEVSALALGANDFIAKPYNGEILLHRLRNAISLRAAADAAAAATRDELTGLYNRRAFLERAAELMSAHEPGYYTLSCLDIDNFKVVNDQYGSAKGDEVLRHIAGTYDRGFTPLGGICCRVSSDNFAVLSPTSCIDGEADLEINRQAATPPAPVPPLTISIGRYVATDLSLSLSGMYDRAVIARDSVKRRFDKHIAFYDEGMRERILCEQAIINDMDSALAAGQFEVWMQPQYNHVTRALVGAEALVRWRHPGRGLVPPNDFIPVFERNGFIYELDKFVWEQSCRLLRGWLDEGRTPLPISVNISRCDVVRADFFDALTGLVTRYSLPLDLLRLEITESAFAASGGQIISVVRRLVEYGFTVEIDDFGSGYSSLNTLKDVPANVLKLDMRFLEDSGNTERGGNILESIVRMAKWLGMTVIAEGVETIAQADYLKSIGCCYVQGYLYACPMPAADYDSLARGTTLEEQELALETVETLDNSAFWDPASMDTLIFNSYVGGACIFEFRNGRAELLRANDKCTAIIGGDGLPMDVALGVNWHAYARPHDTPRLLEAVERAIATGKEVACESAYTVVSTGRTLYLVCTLRAIARAGECSLIYCVVSDITAQREAERKERLLDRQLEAIADNVNGGITATYIRDGAVHFAFSNNAYYAQLGYTAEQFAAEAPDPFMLVHPEDRERVYDQTRRASTERQPFSVIYRATRRDGAIIWLQSNISIIDLPGIEEPVQLAVANDITPIRAAEQRAAEASTLLSDIMSNVYSGVTAVLIDGERVSYLFSNSRYYSMLGYTREQYDKAYPGTYGPIHPGDRSRVMRKVEQVLAEHQPTVLEYRAIRRDGEIIWVRQRLSVTHLSGIEGTVMLSVLDDVTTGKQAEKRILETSAQMQAILRNVNGGVSAATLKDGRIGYIFVNDQYYSMFGYTRDQFERELPNGLVDIILPEDMPSVYASASENERTGESSLIEYRVRRRDGRVIWVTSSSSVCYLQGVELPVHLAVTTDVTGEKEAEWRLNESAEQLRFLNDTAGELLRQTDPSEGIGRVLRRTLECFGGDRAFIYEFDYPHGTCASTYEVCADGASPVTMEDHTFPLGTVWFWLSSFEHTNFVCLEHTDILGDERRSEGELYAQLGASSLIAVALRSGGKVVGSMGVYNPTRHLSDYENMAALGDYMAVILTRRDLVRRIESDRKTMSDLMNDTPGGFGRIRLKRDNTLGLEYFNSGFEKLLGMTSEQVLDTYGDDAMNGVHLDDRERLSRLLYGMLDKGHGELTVRYRLRGGSGDYIWVMAFIRITADSAGEQFMNIYYTDLSDQARRDAPFRDMLPMALTAMMRSSNDFSFVKDNELRYLCCSDAFLRMVGLPEGADISGKTDYDLFDRPLAEIYRGSDVRLMQSEQPLIDIDEPIVSPDGLPRWASISKYPLLDTSGEKIGLFGFGRDVTAGRINAARLRALSESVNGGIATFAVRSEGARMINLGEGLVTLLGRPREQCEALLRQDVFSLIAPADVPQLREALSRLYDGVDVVERLCRVVLSDGTLRPIRLRAVCSERPHERMIVDVVCLDAPESTTGHADSIT